MGAELVAGGTGAYYARFFPRDDYFQRITAEHVFQSLTEGTKPSVARRTGIYLTDVSDDGQFHLLRCSTNLAGPTENFRATDREIVDALNVEAYKIFRDHAPLNHVLAQIYPNTVEAKAKISNHADKTKDMPANGIMAFCTFYDRADVVEAAQTKLRFRSKDDSRPGFTVTMAPNSVYFMPLSTNRLFTHEIVPASLPAAQLPTRLGYVVRCSKTLATHRDGQTFLNGAPLEPPTPDGVAALRALYAEENRSTAAIDYGDRFRFSMNEGDYRAPVR